MIETSITEEGRIKAIPLEESEIYKDLYTEIVINRRYQRKLPLDKLIKHLYLPSKTSQETVNFPDPESPFHRTRELGNIDQDFWIEDEDGYKRIGCLTLKGSGLKNEADIETLAYEHGDSFGVVQVNESFIDINLSDYLDQDKFSNIGNTVGFLRVNRETFIEDLKKRGFKYYAENLMSEGFLEDKAGQPVILQMRFTDKLRCPYIGSSYQNNEHSQEAVATFFETSYEGFQKELEVNGKEKFLKRYNLQDDQITHLESLDGWGDDALIPQAMLFLHVVAHNIKALNSLELAHPFEWKDVGEMGKLVDFAPALDHHHLDVETKRSYVSSSIGEILQMFSNLPEFEYKKAEKLMYRIINE